MKAHRLFVVATAIVMLTSGLGILATAGIHRETTSEQAPGNSPMLGAIRTVFAEDFTNSACGPCFSHNPDWTAAIRAKGYSKVAPAFTHVHWPTDTDPINMYSQMNTWANYRRSMHLINGVPSAWMDGEEVNTHQGQAAYEALIDEYGTVLSPLKITTTGNIDGGTRNGTLNIHVEAVNDIPADQNLRLMTYIWEDAINITARFGSFPNGETVADWAVWLMLDGDSDEMNNHAGELIWSGGATAGDTIDVVRNFQCDTPWELAEMGATVFVQNFNTLEVLNSAVDQFDGGVTPPAHDLEVRGLDVPTLDVAASTTVPVRAVIYNNGATDETNLEVEFTVGGILQDTKYVTSLPVGLGEYVDFDWNTPAVANSYVLGFEVIAVPSESNLTNNEWSTTVQVTYQPEIWTSPGGMDFSVISNWNDSDNITIGNTGTGDCNFNITIGVDIEEFGGFSSVFSGGARDRGNIYLVTNDTTLWESEIYLGISATTDIYHFVYEGTALTGSFNKISEVHVTNSGTGTGFYSSGAINVPLTAGKYYYIGASWNGAVNYGNAEISIPAPTTFGTLQTGVPGTTANYPPTESITQTFSGEGVAYYQKLNTGPGEPDWISASPLTGAVPIGTEDYVSVNINTSGLMAGFTDSTFIIIESDDRDEPRIRIPVNLTVVLDQRGCIFLNETLYRSESTATVTVQDLGLNTDSGTVQTVSVNVGSDTEPGGEVITLTETGPDTSTFEEIVTFSVTNSAGILQVSHGDTITATYNDANDGSGPATVTATASVDGFVGQTSNLALNWYSETINTAIYEDFEDALTAEWSTYSSNATNGRNQRESYYAAAAGTYSWRMDVITNGFYNLNELVVQFDASSYSNLNLSFSWRQYGDEKETMPVNFTGHGNYDGVAVSTDGNNWTRIWEYSTGGTSWETVGPTSIDSLISIAGNVYVKFQQYDNWGISSDGFLWDEIYIKETIIGTDDNVLNWTLSPDDGAGDDDVVKYNIYRSTSPSGPWDASAYIDSVPAGTDNYTDPGMGEPDGINWWYLVRAVDLEGNEDTNINVIDELGIVLSSYDIDMGSYSTGDWSFISFPYAISGNIETILDDSVLGDSGTTWDVARWYNPQDTADPWKIYRKGVSTNDLTTIDNTMGIWVHLTANGGDQELTISQKGIYSTGSAFISLYTGWNLVSYPSATARLASTTLPGQADLVGYYNSGAPYLVTEALPTAVTFSEGNAYWVHVTSNTFWFVAP